MIKENKININIVSKNVKHYNNKGYICNVGDNISVYVLDITRGSSAKITAICDYCGSENTITIKRYYRVDDYCCKSCIYKKASETNIKRYGVPNQKQREEICDKIKQTNLERYGVENASQNTHITNKRILTNNKRYGGNSPMCSDIIKKKTKNTNIEKYNVENPFMSEAIKDKIKKTNLERYGVEHTTQSGIIKSKMKETMLKKYGVEYAAQNPLIFEKQQKSGKMLKEFKNTDINYRGSYELDFLTTYYKICNIQNGLQFKYTYNNKERSYFSDFYVPNLNLVIEIKSSYYYTLELEKNLMKQKSVIESGYNFIFIIDKNYNDFRTFLVS